MSVITKGRIFANGEQLTAEKLNVLVDEASFNSTAVDNSTTRVSVSGAITVKPQGITSTELATDAVTEDKIAASAVTPAKIATDAVTEDKIENGAVTPAKLSNDGLNWNANQFIFTGDTYSNLQLIASDNTSSSSIDFGDLQDADIGRIAYDHSGNVLQFFTNDSERMRIDSSSRLLIGTTATNPSSSYDSSNPDGAVIAYNKVEISRNAGVPLDINRSNSGAILVFRRQGTTEGSVVVNDGYVTYNTTSDYRLKEDIVDISDSLERLKALKPCNFRWKSGGTRVDGFIAHEAQEVVPEAVTGTKDAVDKEGNPEYQGIDQAKLVPLLTKALQEALTKIEALEARVEALES
jgi:hypothetical protein